MTASVVSCAFWLQRCSLFRWVTITMAQARLRFRCPEVLAQQAVQVRLPDLAVYPRCNPLRTSRGVGGHAVTSAPEGRGLHPHGHRVTRPYGLAACLEVLTSCYVNLQEKRKTLPLSGPSHRLVPFSLSTDPRIRTSHQ